MELYSLALNIKTQGEKEAKDALLNLENAGKSTASSLGALTKAFGGLATLAGIGTLAAVGKKIVSESIEAQNTMAQLEAAVKSTGGAAGFTVGQLDDMAGALQKTTIYSDDAVKSAESLLLTFTSIQGPVFKGAIQAVTDLSARMGGDLSGAAIQVGKALNDPIVGITALSRVGVSFTESQKEVIKHLVETNRLAEAQGIILKELETEFGGSAAAARNTLGGALKGLENSWDDLFEVTAKDSSGIIDAINDMAASLPNLKTQFDSAFGSAIDWTRDLTLHLNIANQGLTNLSQLLRGNLAGYREGVKAIQALRAEDDVLERHHKLRGSRLGFMGALDPLNDGKTAAKIHTGPSGADATKAAKSASAAMDERIKNLTTSLIYEDLRAKSEKQLASLETSLTAQIHAGNLSLERRIDLEGKLAAVQEARLGAGKIDKMMKRPTGPQVSNTPNSTPEDGQFAGFGKFEGPMKPVGQTDATKQAVEAIHQRTKEVGDAIAQSQQQISDIIQGGFAQTLGDAIFNAFAAAFNGEGVGGILTAFGKTILAGVGQMFTQLGMVYLEYGVIMQSLSKLLPNPFTAGPAGIAIGVALLAMGSALGAVAQGGRGGGGGAGGRLGGVNSTAPAAITRLRFVDSGTGQIVNGLQPVQPKQYNFTVIGANDPKAQRDIKALIENGDRRSA